MSRHCDVCCEQIHGKRDRICTVLPSGCGIEIRAVLTDGCATPADLCMDCIRDVVKNRKFTRLKESESIKVVLPDCSQVEIPNA
jgi:hypothetical protein